jgi:hypothetical protein
MSERLGGYGQMSTVFAPKRSVSVGFDHGVVWSAIFRGVSPDMTFKAALDSAAFFSPLR